jgi:acyl-coenzyme A synthetase/AMP-(fatty) acid ligase
MSLVKARKNPIIGSVVIADVVPTYVLDTSGATARNELVKTEILSACHGALASYKVPAVICLVESLDVTASGKLARH